MEIGYTTAADIEPFLVKFLKLHVKGVNFKLDAPTEQTTTTKKPTCYVYVQARAQETRVTDTATIGLAYFMGESETVTEAVSKQAEIVGLLTSAALPLATSSPVVYAPPLEASEFTLAEEPTASHAKPAYYATVNLIISRNVARVTI